MRVIVVCMSLGCFGALAAPSPAVPLLPAARFVLVKTEEWALASPSNAAVRQKFDRKRNEADLKLMPYAADLQPAQVVNPDKAAQAASDERRRKARELQASLQKELEAYSLSLRGEHFAALAKSVQAKAKASRLDYVLDVGAVPVVTSTATSGIEAGTAFSDDAIHSCRLLRVDLNLLSSTSLGAKMKADLQKEQAELERKVAAKEMAPRDAEFKWASVYKARTDRFFYDVGKLAGDAQGLEEQVCVIDHTAILSKTAAVWQAKPGGLAKVPDATAWVVANLEQWVLIEARGGMKAVAQEKAREAVVETWVSGLATGLKRFRGAPHAAVPSGWAAAWSSKTPWDRFTEVVVGVDASDKARARIVLGRNLSLEDAEAVRDDVRGVITRWSSETTWQGRAIPEQMLGEGVSQVHIWGRPPADNATINIWDSVEEMRQRAPGTIMLIIEPDGDTSSVFLEFAEAALPPPLKPGILPE
ncbi:MAG: hypothetical protein IT382_14895 [Deltaproteobacteria bacterium]|nr:hypothetical protein [Deltaproteobacteria bacterium]